MKRDIDLIRLLLLEAEQESAPEGLSTYSTGHQLYNLELMHDAGLIVATVHKDGGGVTRTVIIERLTWTGHDFLDATRDSKIWKKAKEHVIKPGVSWTFHTLLEFLKREIEQRLLGGGSSTP